MSIQLSTDKNRQNISENENRKQLLADLPVTERRFDLAGISTATLLGGEGSPIVLLHGPGETSVWWMRVIPELIKTHRVIIPDLPGHGETKINNGTLDSKRVFDWLNDLMEICSSAPTLVGHLLGGSIAARYAVSYDKKISRLVLVNSLGLGKFRPAPRFAFGLLRFMLWPTRKNYDRFLPQCMYDTGDLQDEMEENWEPFLAYNIECAQDPDKKTALRTLMKEVGVPKIPSEDLAQIKVPTTLIWGRHDRANKLAIAEKARDRYGWPLHIIEETRDDPKLERPEAFLEALYETMNTNEFGG